MKNLNNNIFLTIPLCFFIFLFLFIFLKFIFIFFFRAAFEPTVIFDLTPFYVLSGVTNLQLLFLSLVIVFYDTYLHIRATRKNLLYSFIPTSIMLSGLGLGIVTRGISTDIISYAVLFGLLLLVVLIDHRRTLLHPETLATREKAKPEPVPVAPIATKAAAKKPRFSLPAISSIFSIFKRGKKTAMSKKETEPIKASETVPPETPKKEEEESKETTSEPEAEEKTPEFTEPFPSKTKGKEEEYIQAVVGPTSSGGTSAEAAGGLPQFVEAKEDVDAYKSAPYKFSPISQYRKDEVGIGSPIKDTAVQPLEPLKIEEKDKHKEILENVEKIYPKELGLTEEQIDAKKKKIGMTPEEKPPITKEELETLKQKITDRKKEIENETTVIQDVKTDFENIQVGLDSLKNKLENLGGEIESTVQEIATSPVTQKETPTSPVVPLEPRKKVEREISKPTPTRTRYHLEDKRINSLKKARAMLEKLDRRVEKLERIYVY